MALSNLEEQELRNWLDLPSDVTTNILNRVGMADILENAQLVCTAWYQICKDPVMYRVVNMQDLLCSRSFLFATHMCKQAVDRSQGQLVDITLARVLNPRLFQYVADRSSQLRRLEMVSDMYIGNLTVDAFMKFPLLEELNLYSVNISKEEIETVGRYCPLLKTLKVNQKLICFWVMRTNNNARYIDARAIAIGQNLPQLRHLELIGNDMTNIGLRVILDNCHLLETLDLRQCRNIDLNGDLGEKCSKQIKNLKLPTDSLKGCPYFEEVLRELHQDYYYFCGPDYEDSWLFDEYGSDPDFDDSSEDYEL